jgi:polyphosphate kinase
MFNFLTGYGRPAEYRKVLVSPTTMRDRIVEEIEATVDAHRAGEESRISLKMNSLVDARCIRALYEASQAGVPIDINVRGICCLRPGVPGVSETIRVVSIVGRFLEHSRIYAFQRGEETRVLMGSADLMPRNLDSRVELVAPVEAPELRAELLDVLERCFADEANAWGLDQHGVWTRLDVGPGEEPRSVQAELRERHSARAAEHLAAAAT